MLRYLRTDNNKQRVYYKKDEELFCFAKEQEDFVLMRCTNSGKLLGEYEDEEPVLDRMPAYESSTAIEFINWYKGI